MKSKKYKLSEKIKISRIVKDHIETLYNNSNPSNKVRLYKNIYISPEDKFTFFILPFIISLLLVIIGGFLNNTVSNALLIAMTILIPMLFSLLILIYNIGQKLRSDAEISPKQYHNRLKLLREIKSNISFTILISFTSLILLILWSSLAEGSYLSNWLIIPYGGTIYKIIMTLINYYVIGVVILTLLLVLKRFNRLLNDSLE